MKKLLLLALVLPMLAAAAPAYAASRPATPPGNGHVLPYALIVLFGIVGGVIFLVSRYYKE
jgi:hypothetical protein